MKAIFERVSIRRYQDRPVEKEKILSLLRAAMAAPSAANQQPWEFYVVTDREKIMALSEVTPYSRCAAHAPVVIVPVYREATRAPSYAQIDLSIAMENLWLSCAELGLGGVWMGIAPQEDRMRAVEEILQIPKGLRAFALFPLGYPAEERTQQDRYDESRIHFC
ncbi:MAG: nitroreductase family protein [Oscillospiraceae bacterium]|nr:nitroreductase family protein [Oscillospiraceae bacterium]